MRQPVAGLLTGVLLALAIAAPTSAQQWPAYGYYGYGAGYDYTPNPYSYPHPVTDIGRSMPTDTLALYGGYMPNAYYSGAAYNLSRATVFPSGQAFCQTAGSYLYCADLQQAGVMLLSVDPAGIPRAMPGIVRQLGSPAIFTGVLTTRILDGQVQLTGTLRSPTGDDEPVDCTGPAISTEGWLQRMMSAVLTCR